jgi:RNA polymerase sigma factor (sigma-70 family)
LQHACTFVPHDHTQTDEEIARAVQNGDREAFGVLIARYEPKMTRYAQKFLFRGEDVKDIVQEVFIKAYVNILSFDTKRRFSPWLYRIAHNEFINAIKKKTRLPLFAFDLDVLLPHLSAKETAEQRVMEGDMKQLLDTSLGKIDPKYREPLVLYYIQELDYKEIAEILQIPVSTVGVRLNRAKVLLRKTIQKDHPDYE